MIRLYNHTVYPDRILKDCLTFAARVAGVQGDVPVKVTECVRSVHGSGMAYDALPYRKTLIGKPTTSEDRRVLKCPRGWIEIRIPGRKVIPRYMKHYAGTSHEKDSGTWAMSAADWFLDLCIHEMAHIRQYRTGWDRKHNPEFFGRVSRRRRVAHDKRPCEIDADNAVFDVHENKRQERRRQELVVDLAIVIDEASKTGANDVI